MGKQIALKAILAIQIVAIYIYTIIVFSNEGTNYIDVYFGDIAAFNWSGQFNLDFSYYLIFSACWIMWRNRFSVFSIILGLIAATNGMVVFAPYLLYLLFKENGDIKKVLTGDR